MNSFIDNIDSKCREFHSEIVDICGRTRALVCSKERGDAWFVGRSKEQFNSAEISSQISINEASKQFFPRNLLNFASELKIGKDRIGFVDTNIRHKKEMIILSNNALCGSNNIEFLLPKETTTSISISCTQPDTTLNPRYGGIYRLLTSEYYYILDGEFKNGIIKPVNQKQGNKVESVVASTQPFILENIKNVGFKENHLSSINLVLPSSRSNLVFDQFSLEIRQILYKYFEFNSHRVFQYRCTDYSMLDGILGDMDFVLLPMRGFEFITWWNIFELTRLYYDIINQFAPQETTIPTIQRMNFVDLGWIKNSDSGENEKLVLIIRAKFWNQEIKNSIDSLLQKY